MLDAVRRLIPVTRVTSIAVNKNDRTMLQWSALLHATPSPYAVIPFVVLYDSKVGGKERFGRAGTAVRDLMRGLSGAAEEHQHEEE